MTRRVFISVLGTGFYGTPEDIKSLGKKIDSILNLIK